MACATRRVVLLALLLPCAQPARAAPADEIVLVNGDRLSGEIVAKSGDRLTIRTDYAGEISLRWSAVASLRTAHAARVLAVGASEAISGRLTPRPDGKLDFAPVRGAPAVLDLAQIAYLNPKPYETARGVDYQGRALVSAASTHGNTASERLYGEGSFTARALLYRYSLSGKIEHRSEPVAGVTAANWLLNGNFDRFSDPRHFRYLRASLENDRFRDIDRRGTAGAGLGLQLTETERSNIALRGGFDYVVLRRVAGQDERYPAFGWGLNLRVKPGTTGMEIFHNDEGFWNLKNTAAVTLRSKTGLRMPLIDKLNGVAQLNVDWERRPAPGHRPVDSTLLLGVDYSW